MVVVRITIMMQHGCAVRTLQAGAVLAAFGAVWLASTVVRAEPAPTELDFDVYRGDDPIGRHSISVRRRGDSLIAEIEIELAVSFGFIDLFRYRHTNREVWRDGRLISIETSTDDNGRLYRVSGVATEEGLRVRAGDRVFLAPSDIMPTSYWRRETSEGRHFLDTQFGRLIELHIEPEGRERVAADGMAVEANRYGVSGDLDMTLWYSDDGGWLGVAFAARGAEIRYRARRFDVEVARRAEGRP